jgi:hypothetical protein
MVYFSFLLSCHDIVATFHNKNQSMVLNDLKCQRLFVYPLNEHERPQSAEKGKPIGLKWLING